MFLFQGSECEFVLTCVSCHFIYHSHQVNTNCDMYTAVKMMKVDIHYCAHYYNYNYLLIVSYYQCFVTIYSILS